MLTCAPESVLIYYRVKFINPMVYMLPSRERSCVLNDVIVETINSFNELASKCYIFVSGIPLVGLLRSTDGVINLYFILGVTQICCRASPGTASKNITNEYSSQRSEA